MINKSELRKQFIEKRKTLDTKGLSNKICKKIITLEIYKNSKNIFAYYPKQFEADISELLNDSTKNWFLPKVEGENMKFYRYCGELELGAFNVYEPKGGSPTDIIPDLIIVPALCIDKRGFRLGYGKGYYDKFLAKYDVVPQTLTPIFSELVVETLPIEKTDKKIDIIVSE